MQYNGSMYFYIRNAQGDICKLINSSGAVVVEYAYDSWGNLQSMTGSLATTLGVDNPYRYRGYRIDTETGLYYLQSRYYKAMWARFINADDIVVISLQGGIGFLNIFTYCNNNPINFFDNSGFWKMPTWAIVTAVVTIVVVIVVASGGLGAGPLAAAFAAGGSTSIGATLTGVAAANVACDVAAGIAAAGISAVAGSVIGSNINYAKQSKSSGKSDATNAPSWAKYNSPNSGETPQAFARRILNDKYGIGKWDKGASSEFNQIVKWAARHLKLR
jgi:RHS repeat-associated protein